MINKLDGLLNTLNAPETAPAQASTTKVASEGSGNAVEDAIRATIDRIEGATKVASAGGQAPVSDLVKMAQEIRDQDQEFEVKHAHRMGAAFSDGMMERLDLYAKAAGEMPKVASVQGGQTAEQIALEKFAAENPAQYRALVAQGYNAQAQEFQKQAGAEWEEGFREGADLILKTAANHMIIGYQAIESALTETV